MDGKKSSSDMSRRQAKSEESQDVKDTSHTTSSSSRRRFEARSVQGVRSHERAGQSPALIKLSELSGRVFDKTQADRKVQKYRGISIRGSKTFRAMETIKEGGEESFPSKGEESFPSKGDSSEGQSVPKTSSSHKRTRTLALSGATKPDLSTLIQDEKKER